VFFAPTNLKKSLGGKMNEKMKRELATALQRLIESFSGICSFPIKGEIWEELSVQALESIGVAADWDPGSHSPGADIMLPILNEGISSKSGKITRTESTGRNDLKFSSYRTTQHETLKDKIDFFDGEGKNFESYMVLSREEDEKGERRIYRVLLIDASKVNAEDIQWKENISEKTKKQTGWGGECEKSGIKMIISKSMSDQFWITLDLNKFDGYEVLFETSIPYDKLGKTHHITEKNDNA